MRRFTTTLPFYLLVTISGCVGSLSPLYTTKTAIDDERVVGTWVEYDPIFDQHGDSTYEIREYRGKSYRAVYKRRVDDSDIHFDLHLVAVGDMTFWDCHPDWPEEDEQAVQRAYVRLHSFLRYEIEGDKMRLFGCNLQKFERALRSEKVPFVKKDHQIVITATTAQLHNFLSKHGKEIFTEDHPVVFHRK